MLNFKQLIIVLGASTLLGGCVTGVQGGGSSGGDVWGGVDLSANDIGNVLGGMFGNSSVGALSSLDVSNGLKQALSIGTSNVVGQLGVNNGFNLDPQIRIPLPGALGKVDQALSAIGMSSLTNDLELRLNRAAEAATPKAKALFLSSIQQMTFADAKNILTGPNDAATQYLRSTMGAGLAAEMQPIVQDALAEAGAIRAYDSVMGQYAGLPFMPDVKADLQSYVVDRAMDGVFYYVAREEAAIRENPAKRTTELLQKVFSAAR